MHIEFTKQKVIILILAIILVVMVFIPFTRNNSPLEHMGDDTLSAVLFILYYLAVVVTAVATLKDKTPVAMGASIISIVLIVVLVPQTIGELYMGKFHMEAITKYSDSALLNVAITGIMTFLTIKHHDK